MDEPELQRLSEILESLRRRVGGLSVAVVVLALVVALLAAAEFGTLVNYFAGEGLFFGGMLALAATAGFVAGWWACRLRHGR